MKRLIAGILCLCMLCPQVSAAEPKYAALTFDDGPSGRFTRALLDGLAERGVHATFLLCGYRIEQYGELAKRIVEEGHEIGLHGYSHDCMGCMSAGQLRQELEKTLALLPQGCTPVFLRPPGGICSKTVSSTAKEFGLALLNWSVDPKDWATHDSAAVVRSVLKNTRDGDVILLHDMTDSSVQAALEIIDQLQAQGYVFLTASELAAKKGVMLQPGTEYCRFS